MNVKLHTQHKNKCITTLPPMVVPPEGKYICDVIPHITTTTIQHVKCYCFLIIIFTYYLSQVGVHNSVFILLKSKFILYGAYADNECRMWAAAT